MSLVSPISNHRRGHLEEAIWFTSLIPSYKSLKGIFTAEKSFIDICLVEYIAILIVNNRNMSTSGYGCLPTNVIVNYPLAYTYVLPRA